MQESDCLLPTLSKSLQNREKEILLRIKNTNKRTIRQAHNISVENLIEINHTDYQPNVELLIYLSDDLFVGMDDAEGTAKIFKVDFEGVLHSEKSVGFKPVKMVHELKGEFYDRVSNDYLVCLQFSGSELIGYFIFEWKTGKELFNMEQPSHIRHVFNFIAIYRNGYAIVENDSKICVINMMEEKKDKIIQLNVNHTYFNLGSMNNGFELTRNRLVLTFCEKPVVFKWNNNQLIEEYAITELGLVKYGCMIDSDIAAFHISGEYPHRIQIYNLETRQIIKNITWETGYKYLYAITHVGLNNLLFFDVFFDTNTGEKLVTFNNPNISLISSIIGEYDNSLFLFNTAKQKITIFAKVDTFFRPVHSIPILSRIALLNYSDVAIISIG